MPNPHPSVYIGDPFKGNKAADERMPEPESGQQVERSDCRYVIYGVRRAVLADSPEVLTWRELSSMLHRSLKEGPPKWK